MTEETTRERTERLMAETGLSVHQVRKRIYRGESDESIRKWGLIYAENERAARDVGGAMNTGGKRRAAEGGNALRRVAVGGVGLGGDGSSPYGADGEYTDAERRRRIKEGGYLSGLRPRVWCRQCWQTPERRLVFIRWLGDDEPRGILEDCGRHE